MTYIPTFSLEGKVAVITGGRRGIGRAIAIAFAEAGADVAVCDLIVEDGELEVVAKEIQRLGRRSIAIRTDITKKTDVDNLTQRVIDEFGVIDILVNNAAVFLLAPLLETSEDDWDLIIDTNLKGYYLCCQAAGKKMIERRRGNIINMASRAALKAQIERGAYSVAKAGVVMLTRVVAVELARYNIRVNAIAPGMVKTERLLPFWSNSEYLKQREAEIPLGRVAEPSDIIGAALFLASDASAYVTGHTIVVDGGSLA